MLGTPSAIRAALEVQSEVPAGPSRGLGIFGIVLFVPGWIILLNPTNPVSSAGVANLQMLFIGAVMVVCGAIFIAAQWRPR